MSNKIGIGVCTYNRANLLKKSLTELLKYAFKEAKIVVASDGSTDNTLAVIKKLGVPGISGPNEGPGRNKNRLLKALSDCDHIFIVEDDFLFFKCGWEKLYIAANKASDIQHFTFSPPGRYGKCVATSNFGNICIQHAEMDGGAFSYYSKKVLKKCGGFCKEFKGCGWEHCEYSERIHRAGLTGKYKNNHLHEIMEYAMLMPEVNSVISLKDRADDHVRNHEIWFRSRREKWINCPL